MRKLILIPILLLACSKESTNTKESYVDSTTYDSVSILEKTENILHATEGLEDEIKETYKTKETLIKENKSLKKELKLMKDSLVEVKSKLPKKQNFFQKVFNITPDSVEVIKLDTIK